MPDRRSILLVALAVPALLVPLPTPTATAQPATGPAFKAEGVAFVKKHCLGCHAGEKPKADLALDRFADDASLLKDRKT